MPLRRLSKDSFIPPDLDAEARLDPAIETRIPASDLEARDPGVVLLTGATGFLGAFLLQELLTQTQAHIVCLARADTAEAGREKLRLHLESYLLASAARSSRVSVLPGDLSRTMLGLPTSEFENLASKVDAIYHNGAWVNHAYPYAALKASNVGGTLEILRLASLDRPKPVHYVSTLGVGAIRESDELDSRRCPPRGYVQTKWVGDKLVALARSRGLTTTIYRPGFVTGHSETGVSHVDDFDCIMIKGCIALEAVPDPEKMSQIMPRNVSPVDYVSRAIIYLSLRKESSNKAFHIFDPRPVAWSGLTDALRALGYPVRTLPYKEWLVELQKLVATPEGEALSALPYLLSLREAIAATQVRFECEATLAALGGFSIRPEMNSTVFGRYVSYLAGRAFVKPRGALSAAEGTPDTLRGQALEDR